MYDDFEEPLSLESSLLVQDITNAFGGMKELFEVSAQPMAASHTTPQELLEAALSLDGYGWVWLLSLPEGLSVITSHDYDGIHGDQIYAIFNVDLWEHA